LATRQSVQAVQTTHEWLSRGERERARAEVDRERAVEPDHPSEPPSHLHRGRATAPTGRSPSLLFGPLVHGSDLDLIEALGTIFVDAAPGANRRRKRGGRLIGSEAIFSHGAHLAAHRCYGSNFQMRNLTGMPSEPKRGGRYSPWYSL